MENDGTYEHSYYECPSRNLFAQANDSQAETVILHETDPTIDCASHDGKQDPPKAAALCSTPEPNAQKKHGRSGKNEDTPKLGQSETFTAGQGVCVLCLTLTPNP